MTFDWQDLAALGSVAIAVGYLVRLGLGALSIRGTNGAGCASGCGSCSASKGNQSRTGGPLVMIGPPASPPKQRDG